ncbi:MAG: hypothetical protein NTW94_09420 [Legionellales bacterium]|nr:hypothetical protein [Legionellales bacterium]
MSKPIAKPFVDFRAVRQVLVMPEPPQHVGMRLENHDDVIEPKIWNYLTAFPDSAAIRTSGACGTRLKKMYELMPPMLIAGGGCSPQLDFELFVGPVFSAEAFDLFEECYVETTMACIVLLRLVRKDLRLVPPFTDLMTTDFIKKLPVASYAFECFFNEPQ